MEETPNGEGPGPENQFRELHDRPAPEIDSQRLWARIETRLTPRAVPLWRRLLGLGGASAAAGAAGAPRLAYGLATLAILVAVWLTWTLVSGGGGSTTQVAEAPAAVQQDAGVGEASQPGSARLVLLTPGELTVESGADAAVSRAVEAPIRVRLRLVRGYDGAVPADVSAATALGVGGADALNDVRDQLDLIDEHEKLGIVGSWEGEVAAGQTLSAELSAVYRIVAESVEATGAPGGALRFRNVSVDGVDQELVATDLNLVPGRPYILGVVPADGTNPSVFLIIEVDLGAAGGQLP